MAPTAARILALLFLCTLCYAQNSSPSTTECGGSSSSGSTTVITEQTVTTRVWNETTGQWTEVTITTNSTTTDEYGSSSGGNCSVVTVTSTSNYSSSYMVYEEYMYSWTFTQWVTYFLSVTEEWSYELWLAAHPYNESYYDCSTEAKTVHQFSILLNLFSILGDFTHKEQACGWLDQSIEIAAAAEHQCAARAEHDDGMDSALEAVVTPRIQTVELAEMHGLSQLVCSVSFTDVAEDVNASIFWENEETGTTCDLNIIKAIILSSLYTDLGWENPSACNETTEASQYLEMHLMSCNPQLGFLLGIVVRQAESRQQTVCAPPTCNLYYTGTCLQDAELALAHLIDMGVDHDGEDGMEDGGATEGSDGHSYGNETTSQSNDMENGTSSHGSDQHSENDHGSETSDPEMSHEEQAHHQEMLEGFCKTMKVALACAGNHTLSCEPDAYASVSSRLHYLTTMYQQICYIIMESTTSEGSCPPPPPPQLVQDTTTTKPTATEKITGQDIIDTGREVEISGADLVKELANYRIFSDTFLCQAALLYWEDLDTNYVAEFCGFKDAELASYCYFDDGCDPSSTCDLQVQACHDTAMTCMHYPWNTIQMECVNRELCSSYTWDGTGYCCDGILCNLQTEKQPCSCNTTRIIESVERWTREFEDSCPSLSDSDIVEHLSGCTSYRRQTLLPERALQVAADYCPNFSDEFIGAEACGNGCPSVRKAAIQCNETFDVCTPAYTDCMAAATTSCSSRRMRAAIFDSLNTVSSQCSDQQLSDIIAQAENSSVYHVPMVVKDIAPVFDCLDIVADALTSSSPVYDACLQAAPGIKASPLGEKVLEVSMTLDWLKANYSINCIKRSNDFQSYIRGYLESHLSEDIVDGCMNIEALTNAVIEDPACDNSFLAPLLSLFYPDCAEAWTSPNCGSFNKIFRCYQDFTGDLSSQRLIDCVNDALDNDNCTSNAIKEFLVGMATTLATGSSNYDDDMDEYNMTRADGSEPDSVSQDNHHNETIEQTHTDADDNYSDDDSKTCMCDPAAAVHCILDVHHLSKQLDPDWHNLCPLVNQSRYCANNYVRDCDECRRETVEQIVYTLNAPLDEMCLAPPPSECMSLSAKACVTELELFYQQGKGDNDEDVCLEIGKAERCVNESLKNCDPVTELGIRNSLAQVVSWWLDLECETPDEQLVTCEERFESHVYSILAFDVNGMYIDLENDDTAAWTVFSGLCEEMADAWECVSASFSLTKDSAGKDIVLETLETVYTTVNAICTPSTEPLRCYSCQGQGSKSCASGWEVEECNNDHICETVMDGSEVHSRGCKPRSGCYNQEGCQGAHCTYCCTTDLCNGVDNGPVSGSCDTQAIAKCVFDLTQTFTSGGSFECRSVELAIDCLSHEKTQCEMGGVTITLEELVSASLRVEVERCQLDDSDKTCTVEAISTSTSFLTACGLHVSTNDICSIVSENRNRLQLAIETCSAETALEIERNLIAFEATLGFLDCSHTHGFIIGEYCIVSEAERCFENITLEINGQLSCLEFTRVAGCAREYLKECNGRLDTWSIESEFESLKIQVDSSEQCDLDVEIVDKDKKDEITLEIESCLLKFVARLENATSLESVIAAAIELQGCLFDFEPESILKMTTVQRLYVETITGFTQTISMLTVVPGNPSSSVSTECLASLNILASQHWTRVLLLPGTAVSDRPASCSSLEREVERILTVTCRTEIEAANEVVESTLTLIDRVRQEFLVGFCPEALPIPRCLVSRARQCLARFSAFLGPGISAGQLCSEASFFVQCARTYTSTCIDGDSLVTFRRESIFTVDAISRTCSLEPELVAEARCVLTGQTGAVAGCNISSLYTCDLVSENDTCSEVEEKAACLVEKAGECLDQAPEIILDSYAERVEECRATYGNEDNDAVSTDVAALFSQSCSSEIPFTCNATKAAQCLYTFVEAVSQDSANTDEALATAVACLEDNFYCFSSLITLIASDLERFAQLVATGPDFEPDWNGRDSQLIIRLLSLPSNIAQLLVIKKPAISLNLWDICWSLDKVLDQCNIVKRDFPDLDLPAFDEAKAGLEMTIQGLCNDFGSVAQNLEFPSAENPSCAVEDIKGRLDILMSRGFSEYYYDSQAGAATVCESYASLEYSLYAGLQFSSLALDDCSSGFKAQVNFSMRAIASVINRQCSGNEFTGSRHCSVSSAGYCVMHLYEQIMLLGSKQTEDGLCKELSWSEECVAHYSYKCDESTATEISWMWRSVQRVAEMYCQGDTAIPEICLSEIDQDNEPCNLEKVMECSYRQYTDAFSPFTPLDTLCRSLDENMECIQRYSKNCNWNSTESSSASMPKVFILDPDVVEDLQKEIGCNMDSVSTEFGCRTGCMLKEAYHCFDVFRASIPSENWGLVTTQTCKKINSLRSCIREHTSSCYDYESDYVEKALDEILESFPMHETTCVDIGSCAADFDMLVRQIHGLYWEEGADGGDTSWSMSDLTESKDSKDKDTDDKDTDDKDTDNKDTDDKDTDNKDTTNKDTDDKDTTNKDTDDKDTDNKDTDNKDTDDNDTANKDTDDKDTDNKDTDDKDTDNKDTDDKDTTNKDTDDKDTTNKDTDDKDTENKDTDDKDTTNKDTDDEDTDEKDTDEKDTETKDTEDKDDDDKIVATDPSLTALCSQIRTVWTTCIQPGLSVMDYEKRTALLAIYTALYASVEEICMDTTPLTCYTCKDTENPDHCEKDTQTCSYDERVCSFEQKLEGGEILYSAGCSSANYCYNDEDSFTQVSCCYGDLCNTEETISDNLITLEPTTCKVEYVLQCALEYSLSYILSDSVNCKHATERLSCIERYGRDCTSGTTRSLVETSSSIFLELASTSCVIETDDMEDCFSLAIFSMQTILSNDYISSGNTPCVGLRETTLSVEQTIASGQCSETGRVSLESALQFVTNIVGPYCEDTCEAVDWTEALQGQATCSGLIFEGVKAIYEGFEALTNKSNCGVASSYAAEARKFLENCAMVAFLEEQLKTLEARVVEECPEELTSQLPPVCVGTCQSDVVINYIREVEQIYQLDTTGDAFCSYLIQLERVYDVYTEACTSVQQKDVVNTAQLLLASQVERCMTEQPMFTFSLELHKDIYYQAIWCQNSFQAEVNVAFLNGDTQSFCSAVTSFKTCDWTLPSAFVDFIMGQSLEFLDRIDASRICDYSNDDSGNNDTVSDRRKRETCNLTDLTNLITQLAIPPNIATSSFDSRDLLCQETVSSLEQAEAFYASCESSLNSFQITFFSTVQLNIETTNARLCPPLHYEEEGCNLDMVDSCLSDFHAVLEFAYISDDTLCRQASFALECAYRFSDNCEGEELQRNAEQARNNTVGLVKNLVGNRCSTLTKFLYCGQPLSDTTEACRIEQAEECAQAAVPDPDLTFEEGYCDTLAQNVACVQRSLVGCEAEQFDEIDVPSGQLETTCGLTDTDLEGICISEPVCPSDEISKCFDEIDTDSACSDVTEAFGCVENFVAANAHCGSSVGSFVALSFVKSFYYQPLERCNLSLSTELTGSAIDESCFYSLVTSVGDTLSGPVGTADQVFKYIVDKATQCLGENDDYSAIDQALSSILESVDVDETALDLNITGDTLFMDEGQCLYSQATACVGQKLMDILLLKLITPEEKTELCRSYSENAAQQCIEMALADCPGPSRDWLLALNTKINSVIESLGTCKNPRLCLISEAYACVNTFGTAVSQYDYSKDKEMLCSAQVTADSCLQDFSYGCSQNDKDIVRSSFTELTTQVNMEEICADVVLPPPPICPEVPEQNRVCYISNAYSCLISFTLNLMQGDSLIWRQQCMAIQDLMSCAATNTTACDADDNDVQIIHDYLEELVAQAGSHCPWLSESLCEMEDPCPVSTAGCELELESALINSEDDVCTLKKRAEECVANHTVTCTQAQITQAESVIEKKLLAAGLPSDLDCENGDIEGYLYSYLSTAVNVLFEGTREDACGKLETQYSHFNAQYWNPDKAASMALAKTLTDHLQLKGLEVCADVSIALTECQTMFPVKEFAILIERLFAKEEIPNTSFCAQAQAIIEIGKEINCNETIFTALESASLYQEKCVGEITTCSDAAGEVINCIADLGAFVNLTCSEKQEAANCVSRLLPPDCDYDALWLDGDLCNHTVVLQATHYPTATHYVSEAGLSVTLGWKLVDGSRDFRIEIVTVSADPGAVPRCLKGSTINDPIPQVYTGPVSQTLSSNESSEIVFTVAARQDYKIDGPQSVDVQFKVVPFSFVQNDQMEIVQEDATDAVFNLPSSQVEIDDRTITNSVCSSINDPHITTHDNIKYNNMDIGRFILWRHTNLKEAVVVQYSQCSKYGSCNCGCRVWAGQSSITFDLCNSDSDMLTYWAETGADNLDQQRMAVLKEMDLKTYHVILLDSGTIVKVKIEDVYLNVWITPSSLDIGATQGLCGVYDGDGYNDFQLPDFSVYKTSEQDLESGVLSPTDFNNQWKLTAEQANDYTQIYRSNESISSCAIPAMCHTWAEDLATPLTVCSTLAHLAPCGLVNGEDQTATLLANYKQEGASTAGKRRRRRQAVTSEDEAEEAYVVQTPTWPTASGWTHANATAYCYDNLYYEPLEVCNDAVNLLADVVGFFGFDDPLETCVNDILLSDGTDWIDGARTAALELCITQLNENPAYQDNPDSSDKAIEFLDLTCSPYDCSGHGTCSLGVCICSSNYYGTACDISEDDLRPPVLKVPEDGAHLCEVDSNSDCSSVFISGSNFVSSSKISCHIRDVEVTASGVIDDTRSDIQVISAELIAQDRVRCDLGERSVMKRTLSISVSNDGINPDPNYQLYIAFDPVCYTCNADSCLQQTDVCVIGSTCVESGGVSLYNECEYCDLSKPTQWSVRTDLSQCVMVDDDSGSISTTEDISLVLIGAGSVLVLVFIAATIGLVIYLQRRDARHRRQRHRAGMSGTSNLTFNGEPVFDGKPAMAMTHRPPSYGLGNDYSGMA